MFFFVLFFGLFFPLFSNTHTHSLSLPPIQPAASPFPLPREITFYLYNISRKTNLVLKQPTTMSTSPSRADIRSKTPPPVNLVSTRRRSLSLSSADEETIAQRKREKSIRFDFLDALENLDDDNLEAIRELFNRHLHCTLAKDVTVATERDYYLALSYTVRDHVMVCCSLSKEKKKVMHISQYINGLDLINKVVFFSLPKEKRLRVFILLFYPT